VVKEESFKEVFENGDIEYQNSDGELNREDGPAIEHQNGDKEWFLNGERHREDGPAVEYSDGDKSWWVNGQSLTEGEFLKWQLKNFKTVKLNFQ